jgi:hypothetical protein
MVRLVRPLILVADYLAFLEEHTHDGRSRVRCPLRPGEGELALGRRRLREPERLPVASGIERCPFRAGKRSTSIRVWLESVAGVGMKGEQEDV